MMPVMATAYRISSPIFLARRPASIMPPDHGCDQADPRKCSPHHGRDSISGAHPLESHGRNEHPVIMPKLHFLKFAFLYFLTSILDTFSFFLHRFIMFWSLFKISTDQNQVMHTPKHKQTHIHIHKHNPRKLTC